jgi:hypothetical protein
MGSVSFLFFISSSLGCVAGRTIYRRRSSRPENRKRSPAFSAEMSCE